MKKKYDVLFLCQFFYPEYVSSATLPYDTALALHNAGMSVGALCGYPKEYTSEKVSIKEVVNGISICRLKYLELSRSGFLGRIINYFSFTFKALINIRKAKYYKSIVVYSNPPILSWVASVAKSRYGCKLVYVVYDTYPELAINTHSISENGMIAKMMRWINTKVYTKADKIITLSTEMKAFIVKNRSVSSDNVIVIPNWYEDVYNKCYKEEILDLFPEYKGKFVISYLGNMGICQDMETILDTCKLLKDYTDIVFLIAGHGNKYDYVKNYISENRLQNVHLKSFLHDEYYLAALAVSSLSIISLERNTTGLCCPSKAYGYLMAGNPVVIIMDESDLVSQAREYPFGFSVKNGDSKQMAKNIISLYHDKTLRETLSSGARRAFSERYTKEACVDKYVNQISQLLGL